MFKWIIGFQFVVIVLGAIYCGWLHSRIGIVENEATGSIGRLQSQITLVEQMQYKMLQQSALAGR